MKDLLTVGITTRQRFDSLVRCVKSVGFLGGLVREIIVVDDAADPALSDRLATVVKSDLEVPLRVIPQPGNLGYIVARNRIAREATTDYLLNLDDDAVILAREGIAQALEILESDATVGAIAFAQAEADGRPWPAGMQPSVADFPCVIPAFIGFAHLLRRELFGKLGGYREMFEYYGEEKEYCLRLLGSGHKTVFLPAALVAHVPDPAGRNRSRYFRHFHRNDCLGAIYNLPLPLMILVIIQRCLNYNSVCKRMGGEDPGGRAWLLGEIKAKFSIAWRQRSAVSFATILKWRRLRREPAPYSPRVTSPAVLQ